MKLGIVILNYKGLADTMDCLESVRDTVAKNKIIVIVDNASQDNSSRKLKTIKNIHFLENKTNLGFSGGNNVGIKYCLKKKCDSVLILNNDTILDKEAISKLVSCSKKGDIVSPKIYFAKGHEYHKDRYSPDEKGKIIWYAGGKIDWNNAIGTHNGVDQLDIGQFDLPMDIDYATGACVLINRKVFDQIGYFDEKYFLYLEDMDFCVRAKKAGFKIHYCPDAFLWHKNASSSGSGSRLQDYYFTRNRLLFANKHVRLRTKIAVLKQALFQASDPIKRKALFDYLSGKFGKSSINF